MHKKTVLVTGASRGIGRAIAMTFAQNNYHVFLNCRHSISELESVKSAIEAIPYGSCDIFIGDVGNPHSVKELYEMIYTKYDCLDVLVNNAGIAHIGLLSDMSDEEWCNLLDTNLSSVFYCSREAIPKMVSKKSGKVVFKGRYGKNGIVLTKDMCGILTHGDEMPVAVHAVSPNPSAWATGKFIYRNTPIDEVLKELSLYYGTLLYASEHERTITGEFKTDDLGEIIALIEKTLDIKITQKE